MLEYASNHDSRNSISYRTTNLTNRSLLDGFLLLKVTINFKRYHFSMSISTFDLDFFYRCTLLINNGPGIGEMCSLIVLVSHGAYKQALVSMCIIEGREPMYRLTINTWVGCNIWEIKSNTPRTCIECFTSTSLLLCTFVPKIYWENEEPHIHYVIYFKL
mgnify:CR=1 FL=1